MEKIEAQTQHASLLKEGAARWQRIYKQLRAEWEKESSHDTPVSLDDDFFSWLCACSPYLERCAIRHSAMLRALPRQDCSVLMEHCIESLKANIKAHPHDHMAHLRHFKQQCHLIIAYADLRHLWSDEQCMSMLSKVADICIDNALRYAWDYHTKGKKSIPIEESGLFILGMGKLGGEELNYSSDVDLLIFYDAQHESFQHLALDHMALSSFIRKVIHHCIDILSRQNDHGYVWRVDLRLRPDYGTTSPALSLEAAEVYYENMAQHWERAALIKARFVSGDKKTAQQFLSYIQPFIWRRHMDFSALREMKAVKTIMQAKGKQKADILGLDIKRCRGGIRDIEFFVQTMQLIWGGREPALRTRSTIDSLRALRTCEKIHKDTQTTLYEAYLFLRSLEHRMQMRLDQQTHHIPSQQDDAESLALFARHKSLHGLQHAIRHHCLAVETIYRDAFHTDEDDDKRISQGEALHQLILNPDHRHAARDYLKDRGLKKTDTALDSIRRWIRGQYPATQGDAERQNLKSVLPALIDALSAQDDPDYAIMIFDQFLSSMPIGTQLFSLCQFRPALISLLATIMGVAPRLATRLARRPVLIEFLTQGDFLKALPQRAALLKELEQEMRHDESLHDSMDSARRWSKDRKCQLGIQILQHQTDALQTAQAYTDIADSLMLALKPRVEKDHRKHYGTFHKGELAIITLGKWGGGELCAASDLDLIFVYDTLPLDARSQGGNTSLTPAPYYNRLAQHLVQALSTRTSEGELYVIDATLRPSGEQGPLACSLEAFTKYQAKDAWCWEHMALTRARIIATKTPFNTTLRQTLDNIITRKRDPTALKRDILHMRMLVEKEKGHNMLDPHTLFWNLKHRRGGLMDIDYIAQYLQLRYSHETPNILHSATKQVLHRAHQAGYLSQQACHDLTQALSLWQRLDGLLRLCHKGAFDDRFASQGLMKGLMHVAKTHNTQALRAVMETHASHVAKHFDSIIAKRPPL
ncbi:MAG: bifunctional [glutamine synthetase] adenylyltransferase/[glutamine synthetase]-adenylyl-L-tyrosine phosphorylase [Alphaproteobacteria bacterium GM7ARS4]|nr:bifunctional [glutamine synthetase] adenylyltransferase/[glutamine synthetase]-adenylyl-L-tyrosine phosphorylase [Alphaproteobacteria bacterium GM7ARS4]